MKLSTNFYQKYNSKSQFLSILILLKSLTSTRALVNLNIIVEHCEARHYQYQVYLWHEAVQKREYKVLPYEIPHFLQPEEVKSRYYI